MSSEWASDGATARPPIYEHALPYMKPYFVYNNSSISAPSGPYSHFRDKQRGVIVRCQAYDYVQQCSITINISITRGFAENSVGFGFLVVCFLYKINRTNLNPRKITCCGKKKRGAQNATFSPIFSWGWVRLGLWGVRRFHDNIYMFSNPTEVGKNRKHPTINSKKG